MAITDPGYAFRKATDRHLLFEEMVWNRLGDDVSDLCQRLIGDDIDIADANRAASIIRNYMSLVMLRNEEERNYLCKIFQENYKYGDDDDD